MFQEYSDTKGSATAAYSDTIPSTKSSGKMYRGHKTEVTLFDDGGSGTQTFMNNSQVNSYSQLFSPFYTCLPYLSISVHFILWFLINFNMVMMS
jgi:hypothetical protein